MASQWNYVQNGQSLGPVPEEHLKAMLASGALKWDDLVWRDGMSGWLAAKQIPELAAVPAPIASPRPEPVAPAPYAAANPYAAPQAEVYGARMSGASQGQVSPSIVALLRQTKPWVRLLAVLGFIGIGLMLVGSFAMLALGSSFGKGLPAGFGFGMMLAYMLMAGIQLPAVLFLNRYASRIASLVNSNSPSDLEEALSAQKSFWRYIGILTLILLCIYALIFVVMIIAGVAGFAGKMR
ncbi:MAG: DUF4339 domain-containing protein [Holophaga sp.]|nr:DUF4339 domain-containing protein [Holophaga sp.]